MKVAICDFRFHKGHRTFNASVLEAVDKLSREFIFFDNGKNYRDSVKYNNQRRIITNRNKDGNSPLKNRLNSRVYMKEELKMLNAENCDTIICLAFDLITFGVCGKKYFDKNIFLWHHAESDELSSRIKRMIFKKYMNRVKHIVYAPFIKDYLVDFGVDEKNIFVCPWIKTNDCIDNTLVEERLFIAPSGSNDEDFCTRLVEYEKETKFFINNGVKLYIKSFNTKFDDGYLIFYNGYLSFEQYENLYNRASTVVMAFPESFRIRESGTIIDALSSGKRVIARNIPIANYYKSICDPVERGAVELFSSIEEFCDLLLSKTQLTYPKVAEAISSQHSINSLIQALSGIM